jgi:hypothetical protein
VNIIDEMAWTLFDGIGGILSIIAASYALPPETGIILIPTATIAFTLALPME